MLVKATGLEVDFRLQEARQGTGKDPLVYLETDLNFTTTSSCFVYHGAVGFATFLQILKQTALTLVRYDNYKTHLNSICFDGLISQRDQRTQLFLLRNSFIFFNLHQL